MASVETATDMITVKIDGMDVDVPKGTLIIRAAEKAGVYIPRFCDHPLLKPAAACRQCLVEVAMPNRQGVVSKMPKPQPACAMEVSPGMEVYTQRTSEVAKKAQQGVMEFMLINHPLDCPVCDKAGECPLQNQQLEEGRTHSRFADVKRTFEKPVNLSENILLDRDRCILCQRCVRFSDQIAGDPFIQLQGRGGGTPGYANHGLHGSQVGNFDANVLKFAHSDGTQPEPVHNDLSGPQGQPGQKEGYACADVPNAESDIHGHPFNSYFSGNVIQICPVGALTSASYRFRARPFDLVSVPSVAEHDASGSAIRVDYRRGHVVRRMAWEDPEVNEDWITDKDRFAFHWQESARRIHYPLIANSSAVHSASAANDTSLTRTQSTQSDQSAEGFASVSWHEGITAAARGLAGKKVGVLIGGRLPLEDAYAYQKFARRVLGTNDIDFRTRATSEEEEQFLAAAVAGSGRGVTYNDVEHAGHVLAVGLEVEEEIGALFLRLRKGVLAHSTSVSVISAYRTRGTEKLNARFLPAQPGEEAAILDSIAGAANNANNASNSATDPAAGSEPTSAAPALLYKELHDDLCKENSVILVGERAAQTPGALSAAVKLAKRTGARLAWVPRRAGDRGAVDAGALPGLLPGGRLVADPQARADVARVWGVDPAAIVSTPGRNTQQILQACANGELDALLLAGVQLCDLPADYAELALSKAFVVQLETQQTETTNYANVVLPVATPHEKGGTFVNWEGRMRPFGQVLTSTVQADRAVLRDLATAMGVDLGMESLEAVVKEIQQLRLWNGARAHVPHVPPSFIPAAAGQVRLASWKLMLDQGALQTGEENLAATARKPVAVMSLRTAVNAGFNGQGSTDATIAGPRGSITLPAVINDSIPDGVVWVPQNSLGSQIASIGVAAGDAVSLKKAEVA